MHPCLNGEAGGAHALCQPVALDNDAAHGGPQEGDHVTLERRRASDNQPHITADLAPHKPEMDQSETSI